MRMKADILGDKNSVAAVELMMAADIVMKTRGKPDIAMIDSVYTFLGREIFKKAGNVGNWVLQKKLEPWAEILSPK